MTRTGMEHSQSKIGRMGLLAVAAVFIVAVSLNNVLFRGFRLDLTENSLYTLSVGTKKILRSIPEPVNIYFFFSDRATANSPVLRTYAGRVREMLEEFAQYAGGNLQVSIVDPIPFSDDEDRAAEFGLQGINLGTSAEPIYMGIAGTNSVGDEEIIAFLDPGKETFLEYDLIKLIDTLATPVRPVVGLLSTLPMTAEFDPRTRQMGEPWIITSQLRQIFELRNLPASVTDIGDDIAVLVVVHPKTLPDATVYAIDQFILGGGRALIFVDPYAEADVPNADPNNPAAAMMANRASGLDTLFSAWGIRVAQDEAIGDDRFALQVTGPGGRPTRHIGLIGIDQSGMDAADVVTSGLSSINFGYPGAIEVDENAPATVTPLVQSSDLAGPIPTGMLGFMRDPNQLRQSFSPTGKHYILAARIQGIVPSAFADGPPASASGSGERVHLSEAEAPINVVLIADTDLLTDRLWAQAQSFFGQRITTAFASNGDFVINVIDNLTGSGDLISVRGRATFTRPFTRVQALRLEAENRFQMTEQQLQRELQATEQKLSELQANREDRSAFILTVEQNAELERFQDERLLIRKELRQVRRDLDQQIENLGIMLKVINIGLMPTVITVLSIILLIVRRRARARTHRGR